jgi:hypothetical protein
MSKNSALLQKMGRDRGLFQTSDGSSARVDHVESRHAPVREILPEQGQLHEVGRKQIPPSDVPKQTERQAPNSHFHWPGVIKEKIGAVAQEPAKRINAGRDLETIRYREEVKLVQRIFPTNGQGAPQLVFFSSLENETDACWITARTAEILALRAEGPVCAVDANLRSPSLHRYFGIENGRGLSDAIVEPGPIQDCAVHVSRNDLWVIPSGSAAVPSSLPEASKRMRSRMMELRTLFKYVVVSSPLYLDRVPAALNFAADGTVLIVEANATRRDMVRELMEEFRVVGVRVFGVVLNNRTFPIPDSIYHNV